MSERDDYRRVAEEKLDTFRAKIELLRAQGDEAGAEARLVINGHIREAEAAFAQGKAELERLVEQGEGEWEEFQERLESYRGRVQGMLDGVFGSDKSGRKDD